MQRFSLMLPRHWQGVNLGKSGKELHKSVKKASLATGAIIALSQATRLKRGGRPRNVFNLQRNRRRTGFAS